MPTTVDNTGNTPYIDPNAARGYVPPGSDGTSGNVVVDGTTTGTPPRVGADGKPILTYFNDSTVSLGDEDIIILNFLANIPAPGDNLEGGGGPGGNNRVGGGHGVGGGGPVDGGTSVGGEHDNVFLTPGSLTAFFMAYTEMANILRTMINSGAKLQLTQMAMGNELAKSIKEEKKISAESEAAMYIASAVANFADALGSAVNLVSMAKARTSAAEKLKDKKANVDKDVVDSDNNLTAQKNKYARIQGEQNKIVGDQSKVVNEKQRNLDKANSELAENPNSPELKQKREAAQSELTKAQQDMDVMQDQRRDALHNQRENIHNAELKSRDAHNAKSKFDADYPLQLEQLTQQDSQQAQFSANIITKTTQGIADLVKAKFALEKGLAEGEEAMLNSYLQGVNRQLESARDYVRSAADLSDKLQQALMKFSDDARKLGSSISVQSTG